MHRGSFGLEVQEDGYVLLLRLMWLFQSVSREDHGISEQQSMHFCVPETYQRRKDFV